MKTSVRWILTAVCMGATGFAAAGAVPLADRLPSGALAYVGWAGRNLTFDGSMLGQLVNDPWVAGIIGGVKEAAWKQLGRPEQRQLADHCWAMAAIAWQRPAAIALLELRKGPEGPDIVAAMLVDLDKDREAFAKHLEAALGLLKEEMPFTDVMAGTLTYKVHKPRQGPQIAYGYLGNVLFAAVGEGTPARLLEVAAGKNLAADKVFAERLKAVGDKDTQFAYYVDVAGVGERMERLLGPPPERGGPAAGGPRLDSPTEQVRRLAAALGLVDATAVAGTLRVVDRGLYGHARVFAPGPRRGLLMPLAGPPLTEADLAIVPADADLMAAIRISPAAAYDELRAAVKAFDAQADQELGKAIGELEEQFGLSLSRDLLPYLGDTWVLSSAASQGGFLTGTLLTAPVRDAEKLWASIRKMEARLLPAPAPAVGPAATPAPAAPPGPGTPPAGPPPRRGPAIEFLQAGRAEIHYLAIPGGHDPIPVAPAWAIHKDRLYLAAYPQVIQAALARNGAAKPITQDPAFLQARGRIAGKPSILLYCNTPRIIRQVYNWALVGWTLAANALPGASDIETRPGWLPPLSSFEQYLWTDITAVSSDPEGISVETYGSLPSVCFLAPLLLNRLPVWAGVPALASARQGAEAANEMNRLLQISRALQMYQVDQNRMPESLADPKLVGYFGGGEMKKEVASGKYQYLPPKGNQPEAQRILLYLPAGEGRPYVLAAFGDGHIERLDPAAFQQRLKDQTKPAAP